MKAATSLAATLSILIAVGQSTFAQHDKKEASFKWVNSFPKGKYPGLSHGTFRGAANNVDVGYCIYLPPRYDAAENKANRS